MRACETVRVAAPPSTVFPIVADLATYPAWLPLVHDATPDPAVDTCTGAPGWSVELRAELGPFARSKRLRMVRVETVPDRLAVFERAELDGRDHARWALRAELRPDGPGRGAGPVGTTVTMHLAYDGHLWTGGVLERVLDDQIRAGRAGLQRIVSAGPTR